MAEARLVDTLFGAEDPDLVTLEGTSADDILALAPGVSGFILAKKGNDSILGGTGGANDPFVFAYGGKDNDTLVGRGGDDKFRGDKGSDSVLGGDGDETIYGGKDDDVLFGGKGADSVMGELGSDIIETDLNRSDRVTDTLLGGEGNDTMGHLESDFNRDNNAGDVLFGQEGDDSVVGGYGDDTVYGGSQNDTLRGGNGDTTVRFLDNVPATPFVPAGNDLIVGEQGDDFIQGGDEVSNRVAAAVFQRGLPDREPGVDDSPRLATDTLIGNDGADTIEGNDGDDSIRGGEAGDSLRGGDGTDTMHGGPGDDRLFGDTNAFVPGSLFGDQTLRYQQIAADQDLGQGAKYAVPPAGVSNAAGTLLFSDSRLAAFVADGFYAEGIFDGGSGVEVLKGGNDDDTLVGGGGRDRLTGDGDPNTLGEDRFVYNTSEILISVANLGVADGDVVISETALAPNPLQTADIITDFQPGGGTGADTFVIQSFSYRELNVTFNASGSVIDPATGLATTTPPASDLANVADSFGGTLATFGQVGVDTVFDPVTSSSWTLVYVELSPTLSGNTAGLIDPATGSAVYDPAGFDPGFDAAIAFLSNEVAPGELSASDFEFITGPTIS